MKSYLLVTVMALAATTASGKDYPASVFNIYSDGVTLDTRSIQYAIDYISGEGGGRLVFSVGRYLTGSIELKSNVTLVLQEGAVLEGSLNPFDYEKKQWTALVFCYDQQHVGITGKGIIDGRGQLMARQVIDVIGKGFMKDPLRDGRPEAPNRPVLMNFHNTRDITVEGITLKNSSSWVEVYDHCQNLKIDGIHVDSKAYWNNDGIDIVDCEDVTVTNSFIDADDDGICLKSFDPAHTSRNILVRDCIIRSSANGIKFGTASHGVFTDIRFLHNTVYDTYRSAVALEANDGGTISHITVDSLEALHTGNLIFLRVEERVPGKIGHLEHIRFSHLKATIPASKPDAGYPYEGPVEDGPRNVSPAIVISGIPGGYVSDVTMDHLDITHPGGGDSLYARVPLDSLASIPEYPNRYPDFSMFRELPAWGAFIRHARDIRMSDVRFHCQKADFRVPIVLDDVHGAHLTGVSVTPALSTNPVFKYRSDSVTIE